MAKGISTERKLNQLSHTNGRMEISSVFDTVEVVQENNFDLLVASVSADGQNQLL